MAGHDHGLAVLRTVKAHLPKTSSWRERINSALAGDVGVHLAIFVEPFLSAILDGRKTIESRFGVHRCAPYENVAAGDVILLKRSGGPVVGLALAGKADFYELNGKVLESLRSRFATRLFAQDDEFWEARAEKRFATMITIEDKVEIRTVSVEKRDRRGWVKLSEGRQPCLLPHR